MTHLASPALAAESLLPAPERETAPCLLCGSFDSAPVVESRVQMADDPACFGWVRCTACGLIYLSPRVPAEAVGRYYDNYVLHRGPAAWGRWAPLVEAGQRAVDRARLRVVCRFGAVAPGRALLDVGCGQPSFLRLAQDRTGVRAVGTDFESAGWASEPERWRGLELHAGVLEGLSLAGPFDVITLWHVLEHLYHPLETLRWLRGLARRGTRLVIEVPDHDGLTRRLQGSCWAGYHTPRHTAAYTPTTLRAMLEQAGWRVEWQYQRGTLDPYVLWWLGQMERKGYSFAGSLESRFLPFLAGKLLTAPVAFSGRLIPLGFQTAIATV